MWQFHINYTHPNIHQPHALSKCLTVACAMWTLCKVVFYSIGWWAISRKKSMYIQYKHIFSLLLIPWVWYTHRELTLWGFSCVFSLFEIMPVDIQGKTLSYFGNLSLREYCVFSRVFCEFFWKTWQLIPSFSNKFCEININYFYSIDGYKSIKMRVQWTQSSHLPQKWLFFGKELMSVISTAV